MKSSRVIQPRIARISADLYKSNPKNPRNPRQKTKKKSLRPSRPLRLSFERAAL